MITFKQFVEGSQINEGVAKQWDVKYQSVSKAIDILNKHCKQGIEAIRNGGVLWRGFGSKGDAAQKVDFQLIDTTNSLRTSRDYDNAYMLLMAASKHLANFPSRTNALICSTSFSDASAYAGSNNPKAVIPFDGTKVAHTGGYSDFNEVETSNRRIEDIGLSSSLTSIGMREFFSMIATGEKVKSKHGKMVNDFTNHEVIDAAMAKFSPVELTLLWCLSISDETDNIQVNLSSNAPDGEYRKYDRLVDLFFNISSYSMKGGKWNSKSNEDAFNAVVDAIESKKLKFDYHAKAFFKMMRDAPADKRFSHLASKTMKPKEMGLKVVPFGQKLPRGTECWVAGKAVLISSSMFVDILAELYYRDKKSVHSTLLDLFDDDINEYIQEKLSKEKK